MNRDVFETLKAKGYNRIPVYRSVLADLDTPLSVYLKLADGPDAYLLESVEVGETWGRFSIIGLPAARRYVLNGKTVTAYEEGVRLRGHYAAMARVVELSAWVNSSNSATKRIWPSATSANSPSSSPTSSPSRRSRKAWTPPT